jgi:hypothetical protein
MIYMEMCTLEIIGNAFCALPELIVVDPTDPNLAQRCQDVLLVIVPIPLGDSKTMDIVELSDLADVGDCRMHVLQYGRI